MVASRIPAIGLALSLGICTPIAAQAQGAIAAGLPDVLGQTIARANSSAWPADCLALERTNQPKDIQRFDEGAEIGIQAYLQLAAAGLDPDPAYKRNWEEPWQLDGVITEDRSTVQDPWASRISRIERIGTELGRGKVFGRALWNAFDAQDTLLGTYDAEMIRRSDDYALGRLRLYSPGQLTEAMPLTPYCAFPGDNTGYLEGRVQYLERRVADALEDLEKSRARLAEKPDNAGRARRVERHSDRVAEREQELNGAQEILSSALAAEEQARQRLLALGG